MGLSKSSVGRVWRRYGLTVWDPDLSQLSETGSAESVPLLLAPYVGTTSMMSIWGTTRPAEIAATTPAPDISTVPRAPRMASPFHLLARAGAHKPRGNTPGNVRAEAAGFIAGVHPAS